jgi:hypothetical protein
MKWMGSGVFVLAAGAGALLPTGSVETPAHAGTMATPAGGQLVAELELTGIEAGREGESAQLELALAHGFPARARATYIFEVRDDRGRLVGAKQQATPFAVDRGGARVIQLDTGALPDGFYRATATVAAKAGEEGSLAAPEVYLEARGGEIIPLDFSDFAERSAYNLAVIQ